MHGGSLKPVNYAIEFLMIGIQRGKQEDAKKRAQFKNLMRHTLDLYLADKERDHGHTLESLSDTMRSYFDHKQEQISSSSNISNISTTSTLSVLSPQQLPHIPPTQPQGDISSKLDQITLLLSEMKQLQQPTADTTNEAIVLIVLKYEQNYTIVFTPQSSKFPEIPTGELKGGNFLGPVTSELSKLSITLQNLKELSTSQNVSKISSSKIFLYEEVVTVEQLEKYKTTIDQGKVNLKIIPLDKLWAVAPDQKTYAALHLYSLLISGK